MFQYAAGLALAHWRNTVLKLDVSWFSEGCAEASHEWYGLDCFVLDSHFATEKKLTRLNFGFLILTLAQVLQIYSPRE